MSSDTIAHHSSDASIDFPTIRVKIGEPLPDATYDSLPELLQAYQSHSYGRGYGVVLADSKGMNKPNKLGRRSVYRCDRWGKPQNRKNPDMHASRKRAGTGSRKCNCPFMIEAQELPAGTWRGRIIEKYHNHQGTEQVTSHPVHRRRRLDETASNAIKQLLDRRTAVATIRSNMRAIGIHVTKSDIYNMRGRIRNAEMGGVTAIQWLADELKRRDFFVRIDTAPDNPNRVTRLIFAHPASIKLLKNHPDVLLIDCTYKTNRFNMPLLNICGATGNNMTPQFAVAFLSGEKEEDYTWAMERFKEMLA
jgi:hypothetical protein